MKNRFTAIATLMILIVCLSFYSRYFHPWISVTDCLRDPEAYNGRIVSRYREPKVGTIYPDGFELLQRDGPCIRVYSDTTGLLSGEYIGMEAVFHKEGYLKAASIQLTTKRRHKIWISVFPVLLTGFLLVRNFRFNYRKFRIELRENA